MFQILKAVRMRTLVVPRMELDKPSVGSWEVAYTLMAKYLNSKDIVQTSGNQCSNCQW